MNFQTIIGSFGYGPEAVFCCFVLVAIKYVFVPWLVLKFLGTKVKTADRMANWIAAKFWQGISWPFRWAWQQFCRGTRVGANAAGRGTVHGLRWLVVSMWNGLVYLIRYVHYDGHPPPRRPPPRPARRRRP